MSKENIVRYTAFTVVVAIVVFSFTGIAQGTNFKNIESEPVTTDTSEDVQKAELSMNGWKYVVEPSTLEKGVPVEMTADLDTLSGCMRDVVISEFGVRKYVKEGDNIISFTPDRTGTFSISCSMNMGRGTFSVEKSSKTSSNNLEPASKPRNTKPAGACGV